MGTTFFTSDQHFSHRKVLEYCNRPFASVEEMNAGLIKIWNETVAAEDTVYVLGDFSFNMRTMETITPQLNGRLILVAGNHDPAFKWKDSLSWYNKIARYKAAGWAEIHQTLEIKLKNGTEVLLSHLPYATKEGSQFDMRYMNFRPEDKGKVLAHGHLHGRYVKHGRMIDVGMDSNALRLYSETDIITLLADSRDWIPSPLTEFYNSKQ